MLRTVVYLIAGVCLLVNAGISVKRTQEIPFTITKQQFYAESFDITSMHLTVERGTAVDIILNDYHAIQATCSSMVNVNDDIPISLQTTQRDGRWTTIIKIQNVTRDMSTKWKCTMRRNDSVSQDITFKLHVKGKNQVTVSIGGKELKHKITNSSVLDHDCTDVYWYKDGESIDLVCKNPDKGNGIRLKYYNKYGTKLVESALMSAKDHDAEFRKTMNIENDGDYIDCTHVTQTSMQALSSPQYVIHEYTYRTIFKLKSWTTINTYNITVNGLQLVPEVIGPNIVTYRYKFSAGDNILTVTCEKDKEIPGSLYLEFDYKACKETENEPSKITLKVNTDELNKKHLKFNNKDPLEMTADIYFTLDESEPYILGLPLSDILYQYNKDGNTWIIDYGFTGNQMLKITCGTRAKSNLRWIFMNNSIEPAVQTRKTQNISCSLNLKAEDNGTRLICEKINNSSHFRQTIINFHLKPDSLHSDNPQKMVVSDADPNNLIVIVSLVMAATTVVLTTTCLAIWCRIKMNRNSKTNAYKNLTHEPETPIPKYPIQWENRQANNTTTQENMVENPLYNINGAPVYAMPQKKANDKVEYDYVEASVCKLNIFLKQDESNHKYNNTAQASSSLPYSNIEGQYSELCTSGSKENNYHEYAEPTYCEDLRKK